MRTPSDPGTRVLVEFPSGRMPVGQALELANKQHLSGQLTEAESTCRRILAVDRENHTALHLLGLLCIRQGRPDEGATHLEKSVALDPDDSDAHGDLGNVRLEQGRLDDAIASFRRAVALNPANGNAHFGLGHAFYSRGMLDSSAASYRRVIELNPGDAEAQCILALVLSTQGKLEEAGACCRQALSRNLDHPVALNNLGLALQALGRLDEAAACLQKAMALSPDYAEAYLNLGSVLRDQGELRQASDSCRRALALKPKFSEAHYNLGNSLQAEGKPEQALDCYRKAVELKPDYVAAHQNLLFGMNYVAASTAGAIFAEHARFGEKFEGPLKQRWQSHANVRDPERRLRIGYVSGDFRQHPVAHMFEPVLARHDKNAFEIYCYSCAHRQDEVTERMKARADHWLPLVGLSDDGAADLIREDRIDILVDLSGHTANNRIMVFARKPAPVQASWLGYMTTTGLTAIDYRITDEYADPPGRTEAFHTETLWRLPSVTVFRPAEESPSVSPLPVLAGGPFTFACLNNPVKVGPEVTDLWARILAAVPNARLLLGNAGNPDVRERFFRRFSDHGIAESRLAFQPKLPLPDYLKLHHQIDLALDPFPYNGAGTSCTSLWMGVPFVTLAGDRYMARMGVSLLNNVGLPGLVANDADEYLAIACELASDTERLSNIRAGLREKMAGSLADGETFTHNLESAYREMWRIWCRSA